MILSPGGYVLWSIASIGVLTTSVLAWRIRKTYPAFFLFCQGLLLHTCTEWGTSVTGNSRLYACAYYFGESLCAILFTLVVLENGSLLFRPTWIVPGFIWRWALGTLIAITALACATWICSPSRLPNHFESVARMADRAQSIVFLGIPLIMARMACATGALWRKRPTGIMSGFMIYFIFSSVQSYAAVSATCERYIDLQLVHLSGFVLAEITWIVTLLRPDTRLFTLRPGEAEQLEQLTIEAEKCEKQFDSAISLPPR